MRYSKGEIDVQGQLFVAKLTDFSLCFARNKLVFNFNMKNCIIDPRASESLLMMTLARVETFNNILHKHGLVLI